MALAVGSLFSAQTMLSSPFAVAPSAKPTNYIRQRALSEPAIAGMRRFGDNCSECHGTQAEGTERGPELLSRSYSKNFKDSEAFHSAIGKQIPAHRQFIPGADDDPEASVDFNTLEKMGKFLREARRNRVIK